MNLDPLAEFLMSYSSYTYSLNNPIYYNDPTGMLPKGYCINEDYYIKDYYYDDGTGRVIYDPNVHGPEDVPTGGTYIGPTYTDPTTGTYWDENGKPNDSIQILDEVVITASSSSSNRTQQNFTIWGLGTGSSGRKGSVTHSINYNDIGVFSAGGILSSNAFVRFLKYIKDLLRFSNDLNNLHKPNESTMEKKVEEEAKNVPEKIKVTLIKKINHSFVRSATKFNKIVQQFQISIHKDTLINRSDSTKVVRGNRLKNNVRRQKALARYKKNYN